MDFLHHTRRIHVTIERSEIGRVVIERILGLAKIDPAEGTIR